MTTAEYERARHGLYDAGHQFGAIILGAVFSIVLVLALIWVFT